jgi:hypothetical protein
MLATSVPRIVNYDPQDMCMTMSLSSAQSPPSFVISATRLNGADDKPRPIA